MPVYNPAFDLILDLSDKTGRSRLVQVGSQVVKPSSAPAPRLIRNANGNTRIRACRASQSGARAYDDVDLTGAIVRHAIGLPDQPPASGTFPLAPLASQTVGPLVSGKRYRIANFVSLDNFLNVGAAANATGQVFTATGTTPTNWTHGSALQELTAELDVAASYLEWQAALNATAGLIAAGGVTVTNPTPGAYRVTFVAFGPQTAIAGPIVANMSPSSVVSVSRVVVGSARVHEVQLIRLIALPYCFAVHGTPLPSPASSTSIVQEASADLPQIKRLTLDPLPYDGSFTVKIDDKPRFKVRHNVPIAEIDALAGAAVEVTQRADNVWDFAGLEPNQTVTLDVDVAGLVVPKGVSGVLPLNTDAIFQHFAGITGKWAKFFHEVSIQFPGEEPTKALLEEIEFHRDLLDVGSLVPATMTGLQFVASNLAGTPFVYTNAITALRGGPFALEAVDPIALALVVDTLYAFPVNGVVNSFLLKAGAADPDDLGGQVAALSTDLFHWERSGL